MLSLLKANSIKHKDEVMPTGMFYVTQMSLHRCHNSRRLTP